MSDQSCIHYVFEELTPTTMNCAIFVTLNRLKKVLTAQAEAEKIRKVGEAEAISILSIGKAEAERMRLKAEAYQQYGEAAKIALVLEALPKVNERFSYVIWNTLIEITTGIVHGDCGMGLYSYFDFLMSVTYRSLER